MKYTTLLLLVLGFTLLGCAETKDADSDSTNEESGQMSETDDQLETVLTPKIKSALIANPILNEDGNLIDVTTDKGVVYLRGHVVSQEAKDEATQIAQRVLDESESKHTLMNELEIVPRDQQDDDDGDGDGS